MSRTGYAIKNGTILRDSVTKVTKGFTRSEPLQEDLVIFSDGSAKIIKEGEVTAEELVEMGAWQLFNFGPALINEGKDVSETSVSTTGVASSLNPRTAIGMYEDLHYVLIVVDGRNGSVSTGVTCAQLAEFGMKLGLRFLYNLDGGGSTTLYYRGEVVNRPCGRGPKRNTNTYNEVTVSDIIYFGY